MDNDTLSLFQLRILSQVARSFCFMNMISIEHLYLDYRINITQKLQSQHQFTLCQCNHGTSVLGMQWTHHKEVLGVQGTHNMVLWEKMPAKSLGPYSTYLNAIQLNWLTLPITLLVLYSLIVFPMILRPVWIMTSRGHSCQKINQSYRAYT